MPLYLIAPGKRVVRRGGKAYANRFYLVRGTIDGRSVEVSTKTRDATEAAAYKAKFELDVLERRVPGVHDSVTFRKAAELYSAFRDPASGDSRRIDKLVTVLGDKLVREITHADLVDAANRLYPAARNETKNRGVIKPAAAILHYAARNKWCEWLRIQKFSEAPARTRAAAPEVAGRLAAALQKEEAKASTAHRRALARKKRLLIVWLFNHFNRVSEPLRLTWDEHVDLRQKTYLLYVSKTKQWKVKPLADAVYTLLAREPSEERTGHLFPWRTRSGVYKWLRPLCVELGVTFTPHMARHYGGKKLNAQGAGLKTIMGALDHLDPQSSVRYQDADLELIRNAINQPAQGRLRRTVRK
jgi:site-specific recombinase XerD